MATVQVMAKWMARCPSCQTIQPSTAWKCVHCTERMLTDNHERLMRPHLGTRVLRPIMVTWEMYRHAHGAAANVTTNGSMGPVLPAAWSSSATQRTTTSSQ